MCECTVFGCGHVHHDTFVQRCKKAHSSLFACTRLTEIKHKAPCSDCWEADFDRKMSEKHSELSLKTPGDTKHYFGQKDIKGGELKPIKSFNILPAYEHIGGIEFDAEKGYLVEKDGTRAALPKIFPNLPGPDYHSKKVATNNFSEPLAIGEKLPSIEDAIARTFKKQ